MEWFSSILAGLYFVLPVAAAALAAWQARRSITGLATWKFTGTCFAGGLIGVALTHAYARALGGHAPVSQVALAAYVTIGVICLLKATNWLMRVGLERLLRLRVPVDRRNGWWVGRATFALTLRIILLVCFGLPYVMAVAMVYRPKIITDDNPSRQLQFAYQHVQLTATDGVPLDGWWIPAVGATPASPVPGPRATQSSPLPGRRTVILCHGMGANKDNQLALVRDLVPDGYNVLVFDFRAHGSSGGQISSFGDRERRDVLGAVRWLRQNHPEATEQICGLGISMGGAALIEAAADASAEGRAIDAVAVYDTYDDLHSLVRSMSQRFFTPPLRWLATHVALPVASVHAGVNLDHFAPASAVDQIAPRPLMVVHSRGDEIIGFEHGVRLFERASQPKVRLWLGQKDLSGEFRGRNGLRSDHSGVIYDNDAATAVRMFFENAEPAL